MNTSWISTLLPAAAMMLGWGIRGQFGHEPGAMVPGALVGFALALLARQDAKTTLRLGAAGALGCSIGGVETYGQTIGLVQDQSNSPHYWWGMLGLFIKGAVWIGFAGAFLGMARDPRRFSLAHPAGLMVALFLLNQIGFHLLNRPHEPPDRLPFIYFSKWLDPKPRQEFWGGLWLAFIGLLLYLQFVRRDPFMVKLGLVGVLAGGLGFTIGESLQAWGTYAKPFGEELNRWIDWWKVMEMSFGAIAGLGLGIGWLWLHRKLPATPEESSVASLDARLEIPLFAFYWLWTLLYLAEWWQPAYDYWETPFLSLSLAMLCLFSGRYTALLVSVPFLTSVSAENAARYHSTEQGMVSVWLVTVIVLVLLAATTWLGWRWWNKRVPAYTYLVFTAWMQTALSLTKGNLKTLSEQGLGAYFGGSFGLVELSFVLLSLFITWSARSLSGHS